LNAGSGVASSKIRASTRSTLPSTAAAAAPNAIAATAAAV